MELVHTKSLYEFDKNNSAFIKSLIASFIYEKRNVPELYMDFLTTVFKYNTLARYNPSIALFSTYIANCLKFFLHTRHNREGKNRKRFILLNDEVQNTGLSNILCVDINHDLFLFRTVLKKYIKKEKNKHSKHSTYPVKILDMLIEGVSVGAIAQALDITVNTVYNHRKSLLKSYKNFQKTGILLYI